MVQQGHRLGQGALESQPKCYGPDWQVAQSHRPYTFAIDDTVLIADYVLVYYTVTYLAPMQMIV